jgi:hypothetical protein
MLKKSKDACKIGSICENASRILAEGPEGRGDLGDLGIDGR